MVVKSLKSLLFGVAVLLQLVALVRASTTYATIKSKSHPHGVKSISDLVEGASDVDPLVIFQFKEFPLLQEFSRFDESLPFLTYLFHRQDSVELNNQHMIHIDNKMVEFETFEILELPSSPSVHLYDKHLEGKQVILFDFQDAEYDIVELDEFLESIFGFVSQEYMSFDVDDVVLNINNDSKKSSTLQVWSSVSTGLKERKGTEKKPVDNDKLSDIWTEGLIMCLLVSLFLIVLLVIAISWVGSIDISYGALEKSTNPLKKSN